jgi:Carboxypeptidase regulatory-like domain
MRRLITRNLLLASVLATLAVLLASPSHAQDLASITGIVTDSSGAVVPAAVVTLSNTLTGASSKQTTDSTGTYRFLSVLASPGYKLTITREGYSVLVISDITLSVGTTRTQNAQLMVGKSVQTVQVSAGSENVSLNTTDASVGNNLDVHALNDLPVYDRSVGINTLFVEQPGVDSFQGAVTGARVDQSEVTVDGLDVDDFATGQTFYLTTPAPVDSVQQFTGTVAGLNPNIGTGSGGQFQLATKNGTNAFHGNLDEYHRDTTTEANSWFNNLDGLPRTPLIRNQFGGDVGGPIRREKAFFYFDYAGSRIVQSASGEPTVPLPDFWNGNVDYINDGPGCGDSSRINTQPGCISTAADTASGTNPNNLINLDPAGIGYDEDLKAFIQSRYPNPSMTYPNAQFDPTRGDGVNTQGFRFTTPVPDDNDAYVGRIDYNLTGTQKLYGRFTIERENAISELPEFPTDPVTHPLYDRSYGYIVSHVWTIGSNKVNQAYYGDNISKLSFPDLYNPSGPNQYSFTGLSGPYTDFDGQKRRIPVPTVRDDFNWQHGQHSFTMGGTFKWIKTESNLVSDFNYVEGGLTGSALQGGLEPSVRPSDINVGPNQVGINDWDQLFSSALGVVGQIYVNYTYNNKGVANPAGTGSPRAYRFFQTEAYFGDSWKIARKLTLDYGVRYQLYSVPYEVGGDESVPTQIPLSTYINDRITQQNAGNTSNTGLPFYSYVLGGKANRGPNLYNPSYKDFAPRIGFAYTPYVDSKTVINGSAGIVYDRTVINAINFLQDQVSYLFFNTQYANFGSSGGPAASLAVAPRLGSALAYPSADNPSAVSATVPYTPYVDSTGTPYGLAAGETSFVIPSSLKDPYSIALSFGVQQELPGHTIMKLNYVGRLGRRLVADADASQVIDVPDYTGGSTQTMSQAFAGLTTQLRANSATLTPQPWFEDVLLPYGAETPLGNNTNLVAAMIGQLGNRGDIADSLYTLAAYSYYYGFTGFLPTNIGIPSQFGTNAYLTNMGNSNYHGLLLTVDKNMSQGLRAEFNYTWSHSIDNTSVAANENALFTNSNFICDILYPRACRGDSDFDVRQEITSNFEYQLPFGRDRMWGASVPRGIDEVIGGWSFSGLPSYRTGLAMTAVSDAYLASFDNIDPAIFTGSPADLKTKVNVDHVTSTVYGFAGGAAGATKVLSEFRGPIGIEYGQRNNLRSAGAFYFDAGLGKTFPIVGDRINLLFRADAFNLFNHPNFGTDSLNIVTNASNFGQITGVSQSPSASGVTLDGARVGQFSLRLEF